jgi:hypothetical protein
MKFKLSDFERIPVCNKSCLRFAILLRITCFAAIDAARFSTCAALRSSRNQLLHTHCKERFIGLRNLKLRYQI